MDTSLRLPVKKLAQHCNPFIANVWGAPVRQSDVRIALRDRRLISEPGTDDHAGRIAYLVENEAQDEIQIDVGVPCLGCHVKWFIQDGNHRLAAAIFAGRRTIKASVGGQLDYARHLFGVDCQAPERPLTPAT